jgi:hypothetical protein
MIPVLRRILIALGLLLAPAASCRPAPEPSAVERDEGRVKQILSRALTLSLDPQASPEEVDRLFQEAVLTAEGTPAAEEVAQAYRRWREQRTHPPR